MARPEYWVYVNSAMRKAQMHKSTCGSCRFGREMHARDSNGEDWWSGPFAIRDEAWSHAESEAVKLGAVATVCPMCSP